MLGYMENEILCIFSTFPTKESAETVADTLVSEGLAACVQVGSPTTSFYIWEGVKCKSAECPVAIKASKKNIDRLRKRFFELHEYDCPEWVVLTAETSDGYFKFVDR